MRVKKHLAQRKDCGFVTLELPYVAKDAEVSPDSTVLLEDVSNLLANGMFERGYIWLDVKRILWRCVRAAASLWP